MKSTVIIAWSIALLFAFGAGLWGGHALIPPAPHSHGVASSDGHAMMHDTPYEVQDMNKVPSISLEVSREPMGQYVAHISTENFTFAPEKVSKLGVEGEGHAHIYVDGIKLNRVYGEWYNIGTLESGTHQVMVTLNMNNHQVYSVNGEQISAMQTVTVP